MNPYGEERLMASLEARREGRPGGGRPGGPGRHPGPRRGGRAVRRHDLSVPEGGIGAILGGFRGETPAIRHPYEGVRDEKAPDSLGPRDSPPGRGRGGGGAVSLQPAGRHDDLRGGLRGLPGGRRSTRAASTSRKPASGFAKALELDPTFAMAMLGLARQSSDQEQAVALVKRAAREESRLTERERLHVDITLADVDEQARRGPGKVAAELHAKYPDDVARRDDPGRRRARARATPTRRSRSSRSCSRSTRTTPRPTTRSATTTATAATTTGRSTT